MLQIVYALNGWKPELANEKAQVYAAPFYIADVCIRMQTYADVC